MKYNVTLVDPLTYKYAYFLTDICRLFAAGLRSLGQTANLTVNNVDLDSINIVIGGHLLAPADTSQIVASGARYVVFQSEWLYQADSSNLVSSAFNGDQFESTFGDFYRAALGVWDCLDSNVPLLEKMGIPREHIGMWWPGFHDDLIDVKHRSWEEKDIDVLFFGSPTPHREEIFAGLRGRLQFLSVFQAPAAIRNDLIARARINLVPQSAETMSYVPTARTGYLLNNASFIVAETAREGGYLDDLLTFAAAKEIPAACEDLVRGGNLPQLTEELFERYRQRPFTHVLEPLIESIHR